MIALHTQGSSDHLSDTRSKVTNPDRWLNQHGNYLYSFAMARLRNSEFAKDIIVCQSFHLAKPGRFSCVR